MCVDLMTGAQGFEAHLNLDAVAREFQHRGWKVEKTSLELMEEGDYDCCLAVSKGGFYLRIPPGDFMRLQLETLRVKTLIDGYEQYYAKGPGESFSRYNLTLYSGESHLWR